MESCGFLDPWNAMKSTCLTIYIYIHIHRYIHRYIHIHIYTTIEVAGDSSKDPTKKNGMIRFKMWSPKDSLKDRQPKNVGIHVQIYWDLTFTAFYSIAMMWLSPRTEETAAEPLSAKHLGRRRVDKTVGRNQLHWETTWSIFKKNDPIYIQFIRIDLYVDEWNYTKLSIIDSCRFLGAWEASLPVWRVEKPSRDHSK